MQIRSVDMRDRDETIDHDIACSVCGNQFRPADIFEFVCKTCRESLRCPHCGGDGVVMDWGVDLEQDQPYYWIIECECGEDLKSAPCSCDDMDKVAKELYARWVKS